MTETPPTVSTLRTLPTLAFEWGVSVDTLRRVLRFRADLWALGARVGVARVYTPAEADALKAGLAEYLRHANGRGRKKETA